MDNNETLKIYEDLNNEYVFLLKEMKTHKSLLKITIKEMESKINKKEKTSTWIEGRRIEDIGEQMKSRGNKLIKLSKEMQQNHEF